MVVRISKGRYKPELHNEVSAHLNRSAARLIPAIQAMPGCLNYYAGSDESSNTMVNVSVWDTLEHAQAMSSLPEMAALAKEFLERGYRVSIGGRDRQRLDTAAGGLGVAGVQVDGASSPSARAFFETIGSVQRSAAIVMTPAEGPLRIELKGNLAAMLGAGVQSKRAPETEALSLQVSMVAARNDNQRTSQIHFRIPVRAIACRRRAAWPDKRDRVPIKRQKAWARPLASPGGQAHSLNESGETLI